jgi:hypothetical protein
MRRLNEQTLLLASLLCTSALIYLIHFAIFRDAYNIFFYGIMDIAFIPISVLLVTVVINRVLTDRERQALLNKMDMVIGVFFSDVGTEMLRRFSAFDSRHEEYRQQLQVNGGWGAKQFQDTAREMQSWAYGIDSRLGDLDDLKLFMRGKRGFLLRLLENPNLLAHEAFTELLLAVSHVAEELDYRQDLKTLPRSDFAHLSGDIKRAYGLLIREWLRYMEHLKANYPYLFSLAIRVNPFDATASVIVEE